MKNLMIVLILGLSICSCSTSTIKEKEKAFVPVEAKAKPVFKSNFSNPSFMEGSNFGNFFMAMLRTQSYDMAIKFTSRASIEKHGIDVILEKYKKFKFNYHLNQKSISKEGDFMTIKYSTNEYATSKFKTIVLTLENDSCKLVLPDNLHEFLN